MIFGNDSKDQRLVGAKEKREKAAKFKPGQFQVQSKREGKNPSNVIPLVIIFGLSVVFALLMEDGPFKNGLPMHTGNASFDRMFFGPGIPTFTGTPDTDRGIAAFIRGGMIFFLGGILPFFTYLLRKIVDNTRMNVYMAFWGVSIGIGLFYYLVKDSLLPLLADIIRGF